MRLRDSTKKPGKRQAEQARRPHGQKRGMPRGSTRLSAATGVNRATSIPLSEVLDRISKALAVLAHQVEAENKAGFFSKNRLSEDLLLPLFKRVYRAPRLRNLNEEGATNPSIDLADTRARLAIQVTSERSAAKITHTLTTFLKEKSDRRYDRLIVFLVAASTPRYSKQSISKWKRLGGRRLAFTSSRDIVAVNDLFAAIERLSQKDIYAIADLLSESVVGERFIDVASVLLTQSQRQLEREKRTGKYIPDVFVETRDAKSLARAFVHPVLFVQRTADAMRRINIAGTNRVLTKSGLPPLPVFQIDTLEVPTTIESAIGFAHELRGQLDALVAAVKVYDGLKFTDPPPYPIPDRARPHYEANKYHLSDIAWGTKYRTKEIATQLESASARVFILTGRAGQGKTNLVCDLVENVLAKHGVPCAYLSVRQISSVQDGDLGDVVARFVFGADVSHFEEAGRLLSRLAARSNKPCVFVIDGLNEHPRLSEFAVQLEHFIESALAHPHVRLFLTCRSEFFQQRFGRIVSGALRQNIFLFEGNQHEMEDEAHEEMVDGYFRFFGLDRRLVSEQVIESLSRDVLLLRFFCEAYGTRGKESSYQQPVISTIYRDQIFRIYLREKLGTADAFLQRMGVALIVITPQSGQLFGGGRA